jgi:hypothetical protein
LPFLIEVMNFLVGPHSLPERLQGGIRSESPDPGFEVKPTLPGVRHDRPRRTLSALSGVCIVRETVRPIRPASPFVEEQIDVEVCLLIPDAFLVASI